jgi:hypothetical protein
LKRFVATKSSSKEKSDGTWASKRPPFVKGRRSSERVLSPTQAFAAPPKPPNPPQATHLVNQRTSLGLHARGASAHLRGILLRLYAKGRRRSARLAHHMLLHYEVRGTQPPPKLLS